MNKDKLSLQQVYTEMTEGYDPVKILSNLKETRHPNFIYYNNVVRIAEEHTNWVNKTFGRHCFPNEIIEYLETRKKDYFSVDTGMRETFDAVIKDYKEALGEHPEGFGDLL